MRRQATTARVDGRRRPWFRRIDGDGRRHGPVGGVDRVHAAGGVFEGGDGNDTLRNDSDDGVTLHGDAGNDHLFSSAYSLGDSLVGGTGNDFYAIKNLGSTIVEANGRAGGNDTVQVNTEALTVAGHTGEHAEVFIMEGGSDAGLAGVSHSAADHFSIDQDVERVKFVSATNYSADFVGNDGANWFMADRSNPTAWTFTAPVAATP